MKLNKRFKVKALIIVTKSTFSSHCNFCCPRIVHEQTKNGQVAEEDCFLENTVYIYTKPYSNNFNSLLPALYQVLQLGGAP